MAPPFEDIVIVDLDVQKTTWSRVHSAMRTLYLRLNRDPDIAWNKFFFEERNARVEVKRHGLWIEDGYIVFDCLLIDVDSHHLPDIRRSIAYANERSLELRESQREEREQLKAKARDGKLGPADMSGGCFSISSLGGIGGTAFTPIVNAPEVAILGVSKSSMKPVWDGKAFVPRLIVPLSLSYDHRVIDGASAARFAAYLAQLLGDMRRALL